MITASYYPDPAPKREPMQWGPESSRRARAVEVWAALRSLGSEGVADLIERTCKLAERFADGLRDAGFAVLNDVVLNQVLVSFGDDLTTSRVVERIQQDGTCWCGGTTWKGRKAMRISVSSWATTEADVDRCLAAMLTIANAESRASQKQRGRCLEGTWASRSVARSQYHQVPQLPAALEPRGAGLITSKESALSPPHLYRSCTEQVIVTGGSILGARLTGGRISLRPRLLSGVQKRLLKIALPRQGDFRSQGLESPISAQIVFPSSHHLTTCDAN
jgi:hypothetical protein